MLGSTLSRVRGGLVSKIITSTGVRTATAAVPTGSRTMSLWSEMPMGPADPILGLTGELYTL